MKSKAIPVFLALLMPLGLAAQGLAEPDGPAIDRNIDLAAEQAVEQWIAQLESAPGIESVRHIGVVPLGGDDRGFTEILENKLTRLPSVRVIILGGPDWMEIEDELARQDPDGGFGDIMDKATIKWQAARDGYNLPETTRGADALLLGRVRGVDDDWLRARVRLALNLATVDTRERIAGGIAEGESVLSFLDLVIHYKLQLALAAAAVVVLLWLGKMVTRPR